MAKTIVDSAVHDFLEEHNGEGTLSDLADFFQHLGKRFVSVELDVIRDNMMSIYMGILDHNPLAICDWAHDEASVEQFLRTRDCFIYNEGLLPAVEVDFVSHRLYRHRDELEIVIQLSPKLPVLEFHDLRNVVAEGEPWQLEPCLRYQVLGRPRNLLMQPIEICYNIPGPVGAYLHIDPMTGCIEGFFPDEIAKISGAQRLPIYTTIFELEARITYHFSGNITFDRLLRTNIPITIKRRADQCTWDAEMSVSPPVGHGFGMRLLERAQRESDECSSPDRVEEELTCKRANYFSRDNRQADSGNFPFDLNPKQLSRLMEWKASEPVHLKDMELNPLSMAQIWDATAAHASTVHVECRMVNEIQEQPHTEIPLSQSKTPPGSENRVDEGTELSTLVLTKKRDQAREVDKPLVRPDSPKQSLEGIETQVLTNLMNLMSAVHKDPETAGPSGDSKTPQTPSAKPSNPSRRILRPSQQWRQAPEQLLENEKDELQRLIQANFQAMVLEKENRKQDEDEFGFDGGADSEDEYADSFGSNYSPRSF